MKFEINYKIGDKASTVTFDGLLSPSVWCKFFDKIEFLGGQRVFKDRSDVWFLPSFVTSDVLQELIKNICYKCGGLMKDDLVLKNVRKCTSCGHSHT